MEGDYPSSAMLCVAEYENALPCVYKNLRSTVAIKVYDLNLSSRTGMCAQLMRNVVDATISLPDKFEPVEHGKRIAIDISEWVPMADAGVRFACNKVLQSIAVDICQRKRMDFAEGNPMALSWVNIHDHVADKPD